MKGPTVWITGASRGLGAALVHEYVTRGAEVFMTARSYADLCKVALDSGYPERCHALPADVTNDSELRSAIERVRDLAGNIDIAILNAGTYAKSGMDDLDVGAMRDLFEINLFAVAAALQYLFPGWRKSGTGTCVIVGSVAGDVGLPYAGTYSASKSALRRLAESLYPEFARCGLNLHLVSPGFVDTPLTARNDFPMPFMVSAARAAHEIAHGVERGTFDIRFPTRMSWLIRLIAALPYYLKFAITKRMLR